jgi:hypothetical protein
MSAESLLLINPRRRPRSRARRRNPKRSRRMPAALRRYWATQRGTRLSNPRRRRRRSNPVVHSYYRRSKVRARRRNPRRRFRMRSYRRLRNPRGDFMHTLTAGAIGAGGALLLNLAFGYVNPYLPASMQTGLVQTGVLAVGALGLGYLVSKFVSKDIGDDVAFGGLSVVLYNAISTVAQGAGMTVANNLSGYADYTPRRIGAYMAATPNTQGFRPHGAGGMAGLRGLGYVSPAPVLRRPVGMGAYMKQGPMNVAPGFGNYGDGM